MRFASRLLVVALTLVPGVAASEDDGSLHGGFTGEVKPVIYVRDVERSAPFYRDVLGFALDGFAGEAEDPYYAEMLAGPLRFGLHEPTMAGDEERIGRTRLYFRVRSLEAHRRRIEARGVEAGEIEQRSWMDYFVVRDPDGNAIVFAWTDPAKHTSDPWSRDPASP